MSVTVTEGVQTVIVNEDDTDPTVLIDAGRDVVVTSPVPTSATVVVTGGVPGPPGPPGAPGTGGERLERIRPADGPLSGHRAVLEQGDGTYAYADNADPSHVWQQVGVTTGAAADGDDARAVMLGPLVEPSWSWTPGLPVWLGAGGVLTQTLPAAPAAFLLQVAVAVTPTAIFVDPRIPIRLEA